MKKTFLNGVLILLIGSIIAKGLGAVYRIPLTWILGAEGLGIYQLVFPVFSLILVMSSSGMPSAISKMVATAKNDADRRKILKISLITLLSIGFIFGIILFFCAGAIASLQGNSLATLPYMVIAPAVVLVSVLSAYRGYYQGKLNMLPTSMSNVIEQFFKLVFGLTLSFLLVPKGIEYVVLGAIAGVTLSEVVATGYMILNYMIDRKKEEQVEKSLLTSKQIFVSLVKTSFPIVIATIIIPFSLFIDSFLVVNLLKSGGYSTEISTILWGIDSGVVSSLINLPVVLTLAIATAVLPTIASNLQNASKNYQQALSLSFNLSVPCSFAIMVLAPYVLSFLYGNSLNTQLFNEPLVATNLLILSSFLIFLTSTLQTQNASMQAVNKSYVPVVNMLIAFILKTVLIVILVPIPSINIFGVMIAKYAFFTTATSLNAFYIYKKKLFVVRANKEFFAIFASSILMALALFVVMNFHFAISIYIMLPLTILLGIAVYLFSMFCLLPEKNLLKSLKIKKQGL